jgi:hypothetical protein
MQRRIVLGNPGFSEPILPLQRDARCMHKAVQFYYADHVMLGATSGAKVERPAVAGRVACASILRCIG